MGCITDRFLFYFFFLNFKKKHEKQIPQITSTLQYYSIEVSLKTKSITLKSTIPEKNAFETVDT